MTTNPFKDEADPNCEYCNGKGWFYVQNGPDDVDKDPCFCIMIEEETSDQYSEAISQQVEC